MQHTIRLPNGFVHYSSIDAIFRGKEGEPISMEFHPYCGPFFAFKNEEEYCPEEDDPIWEQFQGWYEAKGREKYKKQSSCFE